MAKEIASILDKGMNENFVAQVLGGSGETPFSKRSDSITKIMEAFLGGLQGEAPR